MKKLLSFLILALVFVACKKEEPYPNEAYFYGKWRATYSLYFEFKSDGTVTSIYKNAGFVDTNGKGTWFYDTNTQNLKIIIATWNNPDGVTNPLPGGNKLDLTASDALENTISLTSSQYLYKFVRIP